MPSAAEIAACRWLTRMSLRSTARSSPARIPGGLNWYRCRTAGTPNADLALFSGRTIDQPSCFIAGANDWGAYQKPGDLELMRESACTQMLDCHLVPGAGHWVQQEQPERVTSLLLDFLNRAA